MIAGSTFQALVFDLDGTLLDSHNLVARTVNRVLEARGYPTVEAERVHAMTGLPIADIFLAVLPAAHEEQMLDCVDEYRAIFQRDVIPSVTPVPGTPEVLRAVAARPWALAVATGRRTDGALAMLDTCGLRHYFRAIVGMDQAPRPKPYPDILLEALRRLGGIPPADCLVIGDSAADVAMAHAAGAPVCAVTWGAQGREDLLRAEPDWCVDRWEDLLALLGVAAAPPVTPTP